MTIYKFETSLTASGGTVSANTNDIVGGYCERILINPGTSSTLFRAKILDEKNRPIRDYDINKGLLLDEQSLLVDGVHTIQISDASNDDTFDVSLMVAE